MAIPHVNHKIKYNSRMDVSQDGRRKLPCSLRSRTGKAESPETSRTQHQPPGTAPGTSTCPRSTSVKQYRVFPEIKKLSRLEEEKERKPHTMDRKLRDSKKGKLSEIGNPEVGWRNQMHIPSDAPHQGLSPPLQHRPRILFFLRHRRFQDHHARDFRRLNGRNLDYDSLPFSNLKGFKGSLRN